MMAAEISTEWGIELGAGDAFLLTTRHNITDILRANCLTTDGPRGTTELACLSWCCAWVDGHGYRGETIFLMQTALAGHNCANCVVARISAGAVLRFTSI